MGDVIRVDIIARASISTGTYGYATYVDFDTADYQLVAADGRTPITSGSTSSVVVPTMIDGKLVTTRENTFRINTTATVGPVVASSAIGEIDLDVGVTLSDSQNPPSALPIMLTPDSNSILGTFRLRIVRNGPQWPGMQPPESEFRIGLRHSSAGGVRNSVITGVGQNVGLNILGRWDSATPTVSRTDVSLFLTRPEAEFVRIGDIVPITLKLRANTDARHLDTIQAQVQLPASFQVIRSATDLSTVTEGDRPLSPAASDLLPRAGPATGTFALATATYFMGMPGQGVPQTLSIDVTGPTALAIPQGQERVIGTFYIRPMQKSSDIQPGFATTAPSLTIALCQKWSDRIGERTGNSVGFGIAPPNPTTTGLTVFCQAPPFEMQGNGGVQQCPWSCPTLQNLTVGPVRGTVGVSLEFRSPLASTPSLLDNTGWVAQDLSRPLGTDQPVVPVTTGHYLDVKVIVNAGTEDVRRADTFRIDLENGFGNFAMADNPVRGVDFALNPSLVYRPTNGTHCGGWPMTEGAYNVSNGSNKICTATNLETAVSEPTEVIRLRLRVQGAGTNASTLIWPSTSTSIALSSRANSQYSADVYADGKYKVMPSFGDFDHAPKLQPQQVASLQLDARLQGRRASDPQTRFIQPMQIELRTPGGTVAARHLTVAEYDTRTNAYMMSGGGGTPPTTYPMASSTMRFDVITARPTASQGTSVAIATTTMQFNSGGARPAPENTTVHALDSIEPGTYDVYVKGQSSVGVLIQGVSFGSGANRELHGLVLREGDIDTTDEQVDRINIRDFAAFSSAYNASDPMSALSQLEPYANSKWNFHADLNQSGYIDVLDFSLLASNYGINGATTIVGNRQATLVASGTFATLAVNSEPAAVDLILQPANPGDHIRTAKVVVRGGGPSSNAMSSVDVTCGTPVPASMCGVSEAVPLSGRTITTITYSNPNAPAGPALLGQIVLDVQWLMQDSNTHNLVFELMDATGFDDSSPSDYVIFSTSSHSYATEITKDFTYSLVVNPVEGAWNSADIEVLVAPGPRLGPITGQASILLVGNASDFTYECLSDGVGGNPDPDENVYCDLSAASTGTIVLGISPGRQVPAIGTFSLGRVRLTSKLDPTVQPVDQANGGIPPRLAVGGGHTCGLTQIGTAYCWGQYGYWLGIGNDAVDGSLSPVPVSGGFRFGSLVAGSSHSCGLTLAGKAYCWGTNYHGQLGDGTNADRKTPIAVSGGLSFVSLAAGASHTCGLTTDGTAYCWGSNSYGQVGDGTSGWGFQTVDRATADRTSPVAVSTASKFSSIAAGGSQTCALTSTGEASCWGANFTGQLGNSTTSDSNVPVAVNSSLKFLSIVTNGGASTYPGGDHGHTCALTSLGKAYCWGSNSNGQLGNSMHSTNAFDHSVDLTTPYAVSGDYRFTHLAAGGMHTCGVTVEGNAYCWGQNWQGQLGNGSGGPFASNDNDQTLPTAVGGGLQFASIAAGGQHTCALTIAGAAYCWGSNNIGELGNGSTGGGGFSADQWSPMAVLPILPTVENARTSWFQVMNSPTLKASGVFLTGTMSHWDSSITIYPGGHLVPDVTYGIDYRLSSDKKSLEINIVLHVKEGINIGSAKVLLDATAWSGSGNVVTAHCPPTGGLPARMTCTMTGPSNAVIEISGVSTVYPANSLITAGPVTFTATNPTTTPISGRLLFTVADLREPGTCIGPNIVILNLVDPCLKLGPGISSGPESGYQLSAGLPVIAFVVNADGSFGTQVTTTSVRARASSPNANLWVRTSATEIKTGDIVPVTVGVSTGTRAIDGAQVVLRTGRGVQIVDRDGNPVTSAGALDIATGGALPLLLHRALDAGHGLIELAFGRQINQSISGVSGEATLGTIYLKVNETPSGDLLTIERQGTGKFATVVAGEGDDLTGSLIGLSTVDTVNVPVDTVPVASAPVVGGTPGSTLSAPSAPSAPSRAAASTPSRAGLPARSLAAATSTTARSSIAMTRSLTEDRARGTITLSVPGRTVIELKTGTLAMAPDQYCPVLRHQTYIRLEDIGIAGATFGVEPGGVLSWVSPDQAGCVNWAAISEGGLTFTKETIMQFQLARAVPDALLWVLDGSRNGELYEVDANGTANYVTADAFAANQDHFRQVWANVIPVSTAQIDGLAARGAVNR